MSSGVAGQSLSVVSQMWLSLPLLAEHLRHRAGAHRYAVRSKSTSTSENITPVCVTMAELGHS